MTKCPTDGSFFRHSVLLFLVIRQVLLRKIALSDEKISRHLGNPLFVKYALVKSLVFTGLFASILVILVTKLLLNNSVVCVTIVKIKKESLYFCAFERF